MRLIREKLKQLNIIKFERRQSVSELSAPPAAYSGCADVEARFKRYWLGETSYDPLKPRASEHAPGRRAVYAPLYRLGGRTTSAGATI
jgi:hypothetical protein